jgi:ferrochelatase
VHGVILSYHGTVTRADDLAAFVSNIRRGHSAPVAVVDEVRRRFEHIGGSPLARISQAQARALEARLGIPVRAAGRLWHPYPDDVLGELARLGVRRVLSLPLAPQSVHVYHPVVEQAAAELGIEVLRAPAFGLEPQLLAAFAAAIVEAARKLPVAPEAIAVVLSAHSLPCRVIAAGDPYERDFRAMAEAVVVALSGAGFLRDNVRVAFQSQGMDRGQAWLGPDLETVFSELVRSCSHLLVAPIGFVAEHVETLYDIEVEARALAQRVGFVEFARMAALDDRAQFIDALEAVARRVIGL